MVLPRCTKWSGPAISACLSLALLLMPAPAGAQVTFEYFRGTAFNVPTPLTVTQSGYPPIRFTAHYSVRPLDDRGYYAYRLGRWKNDKGWMVELVHHKVYLENPTPEVEAFEVTHGYNLVTINRGWRRGGNTLLLGAGVVITHPHSTIRGQTYPQKTEYLLSGATIQGAAARRIDFAKRLFVSAEGKFTASWATVPVVDGHARVPNVAFHVLAGLGIRF